MPLKALGKSFDTFCPIGPALVTLDEFYDPRSVEISCCLNGEEVQRGNTRDLLMGVEELIAFLSDFVTLRPGDICLTGTPLSLTGKQPRLVPGDVVETEIETVGMMRNHCVAEEGTVTRMLARWAESNAESRTKDELQSLANGLSERASDSLGRCISESGPRIATERGGGLVEPEHLLLALTVTCQTVELLLRETQISREALLAAMPVCSTSSTFRGYSDRTLLASGWACVVADRFRSIAVRPEHLLVGLVIEAGCRDRTGVEPSLRSISDDLAEQGDRIKHAVNALLSA